ncbi:MAG: alkaline phosphatase family protein [Thermoplasmata archaeon]|nr:alkaline phosphatase family protein [Thermoplasmata archaeon]
MSRGRRKGEAAADPEISGSLAPSGIPGVPRPRYDGRSIVNLAVSVHLASGGRSGGSPPLAPPLASALDPFDGGRADGPVVLFLVDGFGYAQLAHWRASRSERAHRWASRAHGITTVFPSTTTAALASLSTGTPPGRHGLVGYRQYLPRFGAVVDLLKMSPVGVTARDQLIGPHWRPSHLTGAPSLFRRGLRGTAVTRDVFRGSGFTRTLYDGAAFVGYATGTDLAEELTRVLARRSPPPAVYVYWDELDTIQHLKGPSPTLINLELERIAHLVEHVASRLPTRRARRVTMLVTGDHGQVPATVEARVAIEQNPRIVAELARPLAGDRRAGFLLARPGRVPALRAALDEVLPRGSRTIAMEEAVRAGLFGPPPFHPELEQRLGDLLVLVPSPAGLTYLPPGAAPIARHLYGAHGGLETDELVVPLVSGPLSEFGPAKPPRGKKR